MATPPEVTRVLKQVEHELTALLSDPEQTGTVTIHYGNGEMVIEVATKRRLRAVRVELNQLLALRR